MFVVSESLIKPWLDEISFFSFDMTKRINFNMDAWTEVVHVSHNTANDVAKLN